MGTKRKNSNYVTEKPIQAKRDKEKAALKRKQRKIALIIISAVLAVALLVGGILALGFGVFGWGKPSFKVTHHASIEIEGYGTLHVELYGEEAPITVENFVKLASSGFYNGLTFHRIVDKFMAQGGKNDSASLTPIKGEFAENGVDNDIPHERGVIAMARAGEYNSATSQFYIVQNTKNSKHLDGEYAAFGRVTDDMSIIDQICKKAEPIDNDGNILPSKQPVIKSISIHAAH